MKKFIVISLLFVSPLLVVAQTQPENTDNVKVNNKKVKEKRDEGPVNNAAIRKSKRENAKQAREWDDKKYKKDFRHKHKNKNGKEQKEDKKEKKEERKPCRYLLAKGVKEKYTNKKSP